MLEESDVSRPYNPSDDRKATPSRFRAANSFLQALAIPAFIALMVGLVFAAEAVMSALVAALGR